MCMPTERGPLLHVGDQVLHVLGDGFGVEQRRVHPSLAPLEDLVDVDVLDCTHTHGVS